MSQKISTMLWMNGTAEDAARFYTEIFPNSKIGRSTHFGKEGFEIHGQKEGTLMTIEFELSGYSMTALNGGELFKLNPSISFYATLETEAEVDQVWARLSEKGKILMAMNKYPWSEKYGWLQDKFGVSWQISLGKLNDVDGDHIVPFFMFVKENVGRAEEAMKNYVSIFKNSSVKGILYNDANDAPERPGTIKHAQFRLENQTFMLLESSLDHQFQFNEALSLVINCKDQEEIDYYWDKLTVDSDPASHVCGWLKDKYGVSWQVVPEILSVMLESPDKAKVSRVTNAYLQMKKFDIATLQKAFEG